MSVSVDTVYQRVLAILNKEQRGYVTPQEFNLFANQAQMDIFEQYFYDINQFGRLHGNDTEYSDMLNILNEKINLFETTASMTYSNNYWTAPANLYRIGTIIYNGIEAERLNNNEYLAIKNSPLAKPTNDRPVFVASSSGYKVYGATELTTDVTCNYIKRPAEVQWAGTLVNGVELQNSASSVDFELHDSEEAELVYKILELAGISIKDPSVYQIGTQMETKKIQQEKA
jgi:hypothetical protein